MLKKSKARKRLRGYVVLNTFYKEQGKTTLNSNSWGGDKGVREQVLAKEP